MGEVVAITHHLDALAAHVVRLSGTGLEVEEQLLCRLRGVIYRILLDHDQEPQYENLSCEARPAANSLRANQAFLELCAAGEHDKAKELRHLLESLDRCKEVNLCPTGDGIHPSAAAQLPARFHLPCIQLPLTEHAAVVSLLLALKGLKLHHERGLTTLLNIVSSYKAAVTATAKSGYQAASKSNLPLQQAHKSATHHVTAPLQHAEVGGLASRPWMEFVLSGAHKQAASAADAQTGMERKSPVAQIQCSPTSAAPKSVSPGHNGVSTNHAAAGVAANKGSCLPGAQHIIASVARGTPDGKPLPKPAQESTGLLASHPHAQSGATYLSADLVTTNGNKIADGVPSASHVELSPGNSSQQLRTPLYDATNMFKKVSSMEGGNFINFTPDDAVPSLVPPLPAVATPTSQTGSAANGRQTQHRSVLLQNDKTGGVFPQHDSGTSYGGTTLKKDTKTTTELDTRLGSWYPFPSVLNPSSSSSPSDPTCWSETVARLLAGSCFTASTSASSLCNTAARPSGATQTHGAGDKFENVGLEKAGRPSASALATVLPVVFDPGFTTVFRPRVASSAQAEGAAGGSTSLAGYLQETGAKNMLVRMDEAVREQGRMERKDGRALNHQAEAKGGVKPTAQGHDACVSSSSDGDAIYDPLATEKELCLMVLHAMQGIPSAVKAALCDDLAKCGLHRWATTSHIFQQAAECGKMRIRLDAFVAYWAHAPQQSANTGDTPQKEHGSFRDPILSAFVEALSSTLQSISIGLWDLYCRLDSSVGTGSTADRKEAKSAGSSVPASTADGQQQHTPQAAQTVQAVQAVQAVQTALQVKDEAVHKSAAAASSAGKVAAYNTALAGASVPTMVQFTLMSSTISSQLRALTRLCNCQPSDLSPISPEEDVDQPVEEERGNIKNNFRKGSNVLSHGDGGYDDMEIDRDERGSGRPQGPYNEAYKRLRRAMASLGMEPSAWEARGGFMTGCQLLGQLYKCVQQCDEAMQPLMQHLFQVAFTPYVQHVWTWLYTPKPLHPCLTVLESHSNPAVQWWPDNVVDPFPGTPCEGPNFMHSVHGMLVAAGQQLRFLSSLTNVAGDISGSIWWLAQQEAAELATIADTSTDKMRAGKTTLFAKVHTPNVSSHSFLPLSGSLPASLASDQPLVPIVFEREALQQVYGVSDQAAKQRAAEVQRLLRRVREDRQEQEDAARMEATLKVARRQADREAARQHKNEQVAQLRLRQSRMLREQRQAMDAAAAQRAQEREQRIAQEQEMLVSAVMREHTALAAALAAEVARNQALQPKLHAQELRYNWREKRLKLGAQRRALWMLIEAEEEKELRQMLREQGAQLPNEDVNTLELKSEHLKRLNIATTIKRTEAGGNNKSPVAGSVEAANVSSLGTQGWLGHSMPDIPEVDAAALQGMNSPGEAGKADVATVTEVTMTDVDQGTGPSMSPEHPAAEPMDVDDEPAAAEQLPAATTLSLGSTLPPSSQRAPAEVPMLALSAALQPVQQRAPSFSERRATSFPEALMSQPANYHAHHQNSDGVKYLFTSPHWAPAVPSHSPQVLDTRASEGLPLTARSSDISPSGTSRRSLSFRQIQRSSADAVVDIRKGRLRRGDSVPTGFEVSSMRAAGIRTGELSRVRGLWSVPADPLPAAGLSSRRLQRSTSTPSSPAVSTPFGAWPGSPFGRQGFMAARQHQGRAVRKQLSNPALTPTKWGEHPWDLVSTPARSEQPVRSNEPAAVGTIVQDARKLERAKLRKMYIQQDAKDVKDPGSAAAPAVAEVSEVVDAYVLQPIHAQYQLLTHACWELLVKELKLLDLCQAFKLFFFMDAGDFADSLAASLNSSLAGGGALGPFTVQGLLEDAVGSSAHATNEFSRCLTARYERNRRLYTESPHLMGERSNKLMDELEDGDAFCLQMQVKWPLSVVICNQSMQLYSRIVSVLLRLRRVAKVLHLVWMALTKPNCHVSAARNLVGLRSVVDPATGGGEGNVQKQRMMQARRWLSHALPLITSLQGALQGSLVWGVEAELLEQLSARPLSLMEMRETHLRLVKQAASCCFLDSEDEYSTSTSLPSVMSAVSAIWVVARDLNDAMNRDDLINPTSWVLEDSVWQGVKSNADKMMRYIKAVHRAVQQESHRGGMAGSIAVLLDTEFYQKKSGRTFSTA